MLQIASDITQEKLAKSQEEEDDKQNDLEEENKQEVEQESTESEDTEALVKELVLCLFEGNINGVEEYLQTLPKEKVEEVKNKVWSEFAAQMNTRGYEDAKTLSPRMGSKIAQNNSRNAEKDIINWAVSCLILGNTLALEEYLQALPPAEREKTKNEIQVTFETVVKKSTLRLMRSSYHKKPSSLSSLPPPPKEEEYIPPIQDLDDIGPPPLPNS